MLQIQKMMFPAFDGAAQRKVYIWLPRSYSKEPEKRYPVLYMFDGHNAFSDSEATYGKSWGIGRYLSANHIDLIVVGVDCNHNPDGARVVEYSPYDFSIPEEWLSEDRRGLGDLPVEGKGDATLRWFSGVLKHHIDRCFRTIPDRDHTFLMGSSMGGLMGLHAVMHYSHVYGRVAALSPAVELWSDQVLEAAKSAKPIRGTQLYMDYGSCEQDVKHAVRVLTKVSNTLAKKGVIQTLRLVPGGYHCEASWEKQLPFAIGMMMYEQE